MRTIVLIAMLAACGGKKHADTTPTGGDDGDDHPVATDQGGNMVDPQKMDEVQHDLQRKQMIISRCLATAVEAGEAKKTTHGKVALEIVISPAGKATSVKVIRSDFEQQSINDCVVSHVQSIEFPQMSKQYETSYTYAMEAN